MFNSLLEKIGGTEIGGIIRLPDELAADFGTRLEEVFAAICDKSQQAKILLLFDELPYMLQKITADDRKAGITAHRALHVLDILRAIRESHKSNLRMVFAGSIGLHHVLAELRDSSNLPSRPTNDMPTVEIEPLAPKDAFALAQHLIEKEKIAVLPEDSEKFGILLAELMDHVPFYMERIAYRVAEMEDHATLEDLHSEFSKHLTSDYDPWEMEHFRERLDTYYLGVVKDTNEQDIKRSKIAASILDYLATCDEPKSIEQIWSILKSSHSLDERAIAVDLLRLLAQDHYLKSDRSKNYIFRFPLMKKWWVLAQGLEN